MSRKQFLLDDGLHIYRVKVCRFEIRGNECVTYRRGFLIGEP